MADSYIKALISYALNKGMIEECDKIYCTNALMNLLRKDSLDDECEETSGALNEILDALCDYAAENGIIEDSITYRDLFDTALMGAVTPDPQRLLQSSIPSMPNHPKRQRISTMISAATPTISAATESPKI